MKIERAKLRHAADWAALRHALWLDEALAVHRSAVDLMLGRAPSAAVTFVALAASDVVGFVEASLRRDYVNGCNTTPVAFLDGLYVQPDQRRRGVAGQLVAEVRAWAITVGCTELASDADLANTASHAVHVRLGFSETERVVFFRQQLTPA